MQLCYCVMQFCYFCKVVTAVESSHFCTLTKCCYILHSICMEAIFFLAIFSWDRLGHLNAVRTLGSCFSPRTTLPCPRIDWVNSMQSEREEAVFLLSLRFLALGQIGSTQCSQNARKLFFSSHYASLPSDRLGQLEQLAVKLFHRHLLQVVPSLESIKTLAKRCRPQILWNGLYINSGFRRHYGKSSQATNLSRVLHSGDAATTAPGCRTSHAKHKRRAKIV